MALVRNITRAETRRRSNRTTHSISIVAAECLVERKGKSAHYTQATTRPVRWPSQPRDNFSLTGQTNSPLTRLSYASMDQPQLPPGSNSRGSFSTLLLITFLIFMLSGGGDDLGARLEIGELVSSVVASWDSTEPAFASFRIHNDTDALPGVELFCMAQSY